MKRRSFLAKGTAWGAGALVLSGISGSGSSLLAAAEEGKKGAPAKKLTPPAKENINVAFVVSEGVTVIDFAGPWEVFQDVHVEGRGPSMEARMPFRLYTVSDKEELVTASAGLQIMPDHTFEDAPAPQVVVVPAQGGRSKRMLDWLRQRSKSADVVMSVCTGAFVLGDARLLDGLRATTHHNALDAFAKKFPHVQVERGKRFVENEVISTAGGLTSGVDLALHVVERYYGREVAQATADFMEYQSRGWIV